MRVGILALLHESNTFISEPTTLEHFQQNLLLTGEAVRDSLASTHHEIGGFFEGLKNNDIEAVPIFAARAVPFGTITKEAFQQLVDMLLAELRRTADLDGLLVAPHGATVSEVHRDADGFWLSEVRTLVGNEMPIIGTLDAHANLSQPMVAATDALIAYRSNPHLDQRARGIEAATLMARALRGEVRLTQAAEMPPIAIDIERQATGESPCRELFHEADRLLEADEKILSNSVLLGFPYADVEEMGSSVICVTDGDLELAKQQAMRLAEHLWVNREKFVGVHTGIDEALDRAAELSGPICLLDMGDNVGGGSPGDGTFLAHAIHQRLLPDALVCLFDPESVQRAEAAGVGAHVKLEAGGKTDDYHGAPLQAEFTVLGMYDGNFEEPEPRHGGFSKVDQGRSAVVRTKHGLTILLNSRRTPPFSLRQLTSCAIDPTAFHLLVAKGVNAPIAAYQPVCRHLIRIDTPGVTAADMTSFNYRHRRRPMFPFEHDASWHDDSANHS